MDEIRRKRKSHEAWICHGCFTKACQDLEEKNEEEEEQDAYGESSEEECEETEPEDEAGDRNNATMA